MLQLRPIAESLIGTRSTPERSFESARIRLRQRSPNRATCRSAVVADDRFEDLGADEGFLVDLNDLVTRGSIVLDALQDLLNFGRRQVVVDHGITLLLKLCAKCLDGHHRSLST
jgi:hypothetical protein